MVQLGQNMLPINTSNAQNIGAAAPSDDSKGGNVGLETTQANIKQDDDKMPGGAPKPLDQMSTSDFLTLHEMSQGENVMDKLAKIFETILALKLLEETVKNVNESIEESVSEGE